MKLENIFVKKISTSLSLQLYYPKCTCCHLILEAQQDWAWLGPGQEDTIYKGGFGTFVNKDGFRNGMVAEVRKDKIVSITIFKI